MSESTTFEPQAKGGIAVLCFIAIIGGQLYLLRNLLFAGSVSGLSSVIYIEFLFWILLVAGIVICCIRKDGWGMKSGKFIALGLFLLYAIYSIATYSTFQQAYLTGYHPEFESAAGALVGFKLVLALVGVTAGIPVAPRIDDHEYAKRLREKAYQQEAQWAKASVKGAKKDLEDTIDKLKATLSPEEMEALLAELQDSVKNTEQAAKSPDAADAGETASVSEEYRGWGGGM